jgi:hypothetical protein
LARSRTGGRAGGPRPAAPRTTTPPADASSAPSVASATLPRVWQNVGYRPLADDARARALVDFAAIPWPDPLAFAWGAWTAGDAGERLVGALAAERHGTTAMLYGPVIDPRVDSPTVGREGAPTANPKDPRVDSPTVGRDIASRGDSPTVGRNIASRVDSPTVGRDIASRVDSPTVGRECAPTANLIDPLEIAGQLVAASLDHATALGAATLYARPQGLDRVWIRLGFIPVPEVALPPALAGRPGVGLYAWRGGSALWTLREAAEG